MVFPRQSALPFGPETVQGGSEGLHRSPQAGWKECEGILQTGSSLQGTQGKGSPPRDPSTATFVPVLALGDEVKQHLLSSCSQTLW